MCQDALSQSSVLSAEQYDVLPLQPICNWTPCILLLAIIYHDLRSVKNLKDEKRLTNNIRSLIIHSFCKICEHSREVVEFWCGLAQHSKHIAELFCLRLTLALLLTAAITLTLRPLAPQTSATYSHKQLDVKRWQGFGRHRVKSKG